MLQVQMLAGQVALLKLVEDISSLNEPLVLWMSDLPFQSRTQDSISDHNHSQVHAPALNSSGV